MPLETDDTVMPRWPSAAKVRVAVWPHSSAVRSNRPYQKHHQMPEETAPQPRPTWSGTHYQHATPAGRVLATHRGTT